VGAAEIRTAADRSITDPYRGNESYNRLSYNSAFPWQADGPHGEVAMNYVFQNKDQQWEPLRLFTFRKFEQGVYYREAELESNKNIRLSLADVTLPNGILRVDKSSGTEGAPMRLGHYALPNLTGTIRRESRTVKCVPVQIIDNGTYQLALVPLSGWSKPEAVDATGLHPVKAQSTVLNVAATLAPDQPKQPVLYAALMLWKKSGQPWKDAELLPVRKVAYSAQGNSAVVFWATGKTQRLQF
jgi:hypothetical protein